MIRHSVSFVPAVTKLLLVLWVPLVAAFAAPALADGPRTTSYQGVLTDDGGVPLPDGSYALTFRLYNLSSGGTAVWTENHPAVSLEKGAFSVILGSIAPLPAGFQTQKWLGVQVGGDPELAPRVPLAGAPWALDLALPWAAAANSAQPALSLSNAGAGAALEVQGTVQLKPEGGAGSGEIQVTSAAFPTTALKLNASNIGGYAAGYDEAGQPAWDLAGDASAGSGGYFRVFRSAGFAPGFVVDGNVAGSGNAQVSIIGNDRSATFNMNATDNASVLLPGNAIGAAEILDEPGVASTADTTVEFLDSPWEPLATISSVAPVPGYVFAVVTAQVNVSHTNGIESAAEFGLVEGFASNVPVHRIEVRLPAGAGAGDYHLPLTVTGVFPTEPGSNPVVLLRGKKTSGTWISVDQVRSTVLYVPTAYGLIEAAPQQVTTGVPTPDAARARATATNDARIQRELDAMRSELEALKHQVAAESAAQTAPARR